MLGMLTIGLAEEYDQGLLPVSATTTYVFPAVKFSGVMLRKKYPPTRGSESCTLVEAKSCPEVLKIPTVSPAKSSLRSKKPKAVTVMEVLAVKTIPRFTE